MFGRIPRPVWVLSSMLVMLLIGGGVWAQIGDPYDLSWSTIDNGGATFSTGGDFQLGGTIGQADAGSLTGGVYTLNGGFWPGVACAAPAVPHNLTIANTAGDVELTWDPVAEAAGYEIYRAINDAYFAPGSSYAIIAGSPWTDPDTDEIGTPAENHFYLVHAVNGCGASANSQRTGAFDFAITPGD